MGTSLKDACSRNAPILGAGLVVLALGTLVFALTASHGRARTDAPPVEIARGAPIRSAVVKVAAPAAMDRAQQDGENPAASDPPEFEELKFATLSGFDYPKSGSFQVGTQTKPTTAERPPAAPMPATKIPAAVRALDGRRVTITGFMNPIEFDRDGVKSFALTSIPGGCCYGAIPRLNEWIVVTMPEGELAEYAYYDPVTLFGTLAVSELYEEGVILSLYRMTPERIDIGY